MVRVPRFRFKLFVSNHCTHSVSANAPQLRATFSTPFKTPHINHERDPLFVSSAVFVSSNRPTTAVVNLGNTSAFLSLKRHCYQMRLVSNSKAYVEKHILVTLYYQVYESGQAENGAREAAKKGRKPCA